MKKTFIILLLAIGLVSCKGSSGKKALDIGKKVYKEWKKVPQPAKSKLNREIRNQFLERIESHQEICSSCGGYGVLCLVDEYGNPIYDYDGNLQTITCEDCGGYGAISY